MLGLILYLVFSRGCHEWFSVPEYSADCLRSYHLRNEMTNCRVESDFKTRLCVALVHGAFFRAWEFWISHVYLTFLRSSKNLCWLKPPSPPPPPPRTGSGAAMHPNSFVISGAVWMIYFLASLRSYFLDNWPFHFQAGNHKRRRPRRKPGLLELSAILAPAPGWWAPVTSANAVGVFSPS